MGNRCFVFQKVDVAAKSISLFVDLIETNIVVTSYIIHTSRRSTRQLL